MKEFNIKKGTIKIGTLHEYRETELQHIADKKEGRLDFILKFDGIVKITSEWFNTITGNGVSIGNGLPIRFPGRTKAKFEKLHLISHDDYHITLKDTTAVIEREALNSFVFCMSDIRRMRDCAEIFPEYNDYWYLPRLRAFKFGVAIGILIREAIIEGHRTEQYIVPKSTSLEDLSVGLSMSLVDYSPREIHITNNNNFTLEDFIQKMENIAFIKPAAPFEKEREFRFNYTITSEGMIIQPTVKHLILNSEKLQEFII